MFEESYLDFITGRGEPTTPQTSTWDGVGSVKTLAVAWTAFFMAVMTLAPMVTKTFFPSFWKGLDDGKRNELPSFVASLVHHLVVAPVGLHLFFKDWARVPAEYLTMDYALSFGGLWSVPFAFGYMAADSIIFTFPQLLKGHYEYAMHHGAALTLFYGFVSTSGAVVRFMPAIYLCECSGVIFATAWFVRNGGGRDTAFLKFLELSFAVVFFITRIINFPLSMYTLMNLPTTMDSVGIIRFALFPLIVLQFYWFYMIIKTLEKKKKTAAAARDEKKA